MPHYAQIQNGKVVAVTESSQTIHADNMVEIDGLRVELLGAAYDGATFTPAPSVAVAQVSMRQAKRALHAAGKTAAVEAAINALPEPQKSEALIDWNATGDVHRNHPSVAFIGAAAGLNSAEIDALFAAAALIP